MLFALIATLAADALLISDGPDFMFNALNQQEILAPHMRVTFALLQYPMLFLSQLTENFGALRLAYSIPMVLAPLVTLMLSWWIVKDVRPDLFVWAAFGILLVNLPGQINWVATAIRTNQFFWPILLSILIGMPNRAIIPSIILAQLILLLHPHAAAYFLAGCCAALWIAWRNPDMRTRLLKTAGLLAFGAIFRLAFPASEYERQYGTISHQFEMAKRVVNGPVLWALIGLAVTAALIIVSARSNHRRLVCLLATLTLVAAGITFIVWGFDPAGIQGSSSYRGSVVVFAAMMMGLAFLDTVLPGRSASTPFTIAWRQSLASLACVVFCITIAIQSTVLAREVNYVESVLEEATTACVPESTLDNFESSPMNNFAFPAASLMLQNRQPNHIILPDEQCARVTDTGQFPIWRNLDARSVASGWIDLAPLQFALQNQNVCWVDMPGNWHHKEESVNGDWGVWSKDRGTFEFLAKEPVTVVFNADIRTFIPDSIITIELNGYHVANQEITEDFQGIGPLTLNLSTGANVLTFTSNQKPQRPPTNQNEVNGDDREMTFMLWNPVFTTADGTACNYRSKILPDTRIAVSGNLLPAEPEQ